MEIFIVVAVVLVLVVIGATRGLNTSKSETATSTYKPRAPFMSKAELSFFGVLRQAVADRAYIAPKVRVAELGLGGILLLLFGRSRSLST